MESAVAPEYYLKRRDKVRQIVSRNKLDALLITDPINVRYLTNFTGNAGCLMVKPSGDTFLCDPRFTFQIEEECPNLETIIRPRSEPTSQTLQFLLGKTTSGKLGIEAESVTIAQQERLFQDLSHWQPVPTQQIIENLRQIKDKEEIALIRKAVDIASNAWNTIRGFMLPNMTENDLSVILEGTMRAMGAEEKSFPTIVGAGARAALPHGKPSVQTMYGQSHILVDWGCIYQGYMSDLTRVWTLPYKQTPAHKKKFRAIYETVLKAQEAAIRAIKPGAVCEDIDAVARNIISEAGYGKHFGHGLGHSIGLRIHESPRFTPGDKTVLKAGMVLTVEPGIYLKDWGGVRIEDDILVTRSGCEVLSEHVSKSHDEAILQFSDNPV